MNANYFDFMAGQEVTIRDIISQKNDTTADLFCFDVSLVEISSIPWLTMQLDTLFGKMDSVRLKYNLNCKITNGDSVLSP